MNPIAVLGGLVLLFFAPGFFLLHALFPGRRYFGPFHALAMPLLSVVASLVALILVGSALGAAGRFFATEIVVSLGILSAALFAIAWWRGAFPLLGRAPRKEYASFEEGVKGTLEPGMLADLQVYRGDPLEDADVDWEQLRPRAVLLGGMKVFGSLS